MAYFLFLLANAALFIRPGELIPALDGAPVYLWLIVAAIVAALGPLQHQLRWETMVRQPTNLCVVGILVGVVLSHASIMYFGGLVTGAVEMSKLLLYYLLLVGLVTTPSRFRTFLTTTALASTLMVGFSVDSYFDFLSEWEGSASLASAREEDRARTAAGQAPVLPHVVERHGETIEGNRGYTFRMRGLGIFNDPNDVSLLIAVTLMISAYFFGDRDMGPQRIVWIVPMAVGLVGLYCTKSRGGVLALGAGGMAFIFMRYGARVTAAFGALGLLAIPVVLGRAGEIDVTSGSGQQRIQLWSDGLAAIKGPRIVFGIGQGMYDQYAELVAHNSFIHAFVELGLIGGTFFFGCVFFPLVAFWRLYRQQIRLSVPELHRLRPYVVGILVAWSMGMCSLSRCYTASTYMVFGVAAAFINLAGYYRTNPAPLVKLHPLLVQRWVAASIGVLAFSFLFVRMFATYS